MTSTFGQPGQPFFSSSVPQQPLCELPSGVRTVVWREESTACHAALEYHKHTCLGRPHTKSGRDHALANGWTAPQQAFALAGHHPGSKHMCNLCVCVLGEEGAVGILAVSVQPSARAAIVQAIHVTPSMRGPLQLSSRMWHTTCTCVAEIAREKGEKLVRFSLELPCCQSQQGAYFWIYRMGWDGTVDARKAAKAWRSGRKWLVGEYALWYKMEVQ